jgi:putative chitinase
MAIFDSVGPKCKNERRDARVIQLLINMNLHKLFPLSPLVVDGRPGERTFVAIAEFQRRELKMKEPTRRVDPDSPTLKRLLAGMPGNLTQEKIWAIIPGATEAVIGRYYDGLITAMLSNNISTPLRVAHFLSQIGHESVDMRYGEEIASGEAYEGRADLGNTQAGDGKRFKGRGLLQLTGRANYIAFGQARGKDFISGENPKQIASDPALGVDVSCWYWVQHNINALADLDDVKAVTKAINGGYNGLDDRKQRLIRAKAILMPDAAAPAPLLAIP